MPKYFNTIKEYLSAEEKFKDALFEYNELNEEIKPIYIYPEGYHELTEDEIKLCDALNEKIIEAIFNDDDEECQRLHSLFPDFGPLPIIDIEKTLELISDKDKKFFIDKLEYKAFREMILLKCINCNYEEKVEYDFVLDSWVDGLYPILYCPHCNEHKFVPIDIYNKRKKLLS